MIIMVKVCRWRSWSKYCTRGNCLLLGLKMKQLLLAILLISLINAAYSGNYYVSNSGSDNNPGTKVSPWATLEKVEKSARSGDQIYLHRGSAWKTQFTLRSSDMLVDAYGDGPPPAIDGSSAYFSIAMVGKSNITIRNLKLVNAAEDCIRVEQRGDIAHHILIENNIITGCKTNGINFSPLNDDIAANKLPYDIQILNNKISYCGNSAIIIRAQADAGDNRIAYNVIDNVGTIYPTNAISLHYVHNIVVEHNTITNTRSTSIDGSGITADYLKDTYGSGSIIRFNSVVCPTPPVNDAQAGIAVWYQPNVQIYNNTIRNCNDGIRVSGKVSTGYEIHHNYIIDTRKRGVSFTDAASSGKLEYNKLSGVNNEGYGISVNRGSNAPDEKYNNIYNFQTGMNDMNKPHATLHVTDTNLPPR